MKRPSRLFRAVTHALVLLALPVGAARAQYFERVITFGADYDRIAPDVRSRALGGAVVAVPSGPADVWWNPASLPTHHAVEFQYAPVKWPADIGLTTTAAAGEWRNLRLGVARTALDADPIPVRTAYQPEGNGSFIEPKACTWTINGSADLAPWLLPAHPEINIALGLSARHVLNDLSVAEVAAWEMDVGLIAARRWQGERAWWRLRAAAMVRNALGGHYNVEGLEGTLPRDLRFGAACEVGMEPEAGRRAPLQAMIAYGRFQHLDGWRNPDRDHFGLELTLFELLSPRVGYAPRSPLGESSYGLGLQLARPGSLPIGLRVDYAREEFEGFGAWRDQWALTLFGDL